MRTLLALLVLISPAWSAWENVAQNWPGITPEMRTWFKEQRSQHGVPCCSVADGHRTDWKQDRQGHYYVPLDGEWLLVPPEAVILTANPVPKYCREVEHACDTEPGDGVVWYVRQGPDAIYIRCFVPGGGL